MLSETLATGLERYEIGPKVRALRQQKRLGLVELGAHTGLSPGMLSKIERGQLFPTLPTLLRIALVFGVGLDHFFVETDSKPVMAVVRRKDRIRMPHRPDAKAPSYTFESLDFAAVDRRMDAYLADFPRDGVRSEPHEHDGVEFIYVLKGKISVEVDGREATLNAGDALYFDSSVPHTYAQSGNGASALVVVVPPNRPIGGSGSRESR